MAKATMVQGKKGEVVKGYTLLEAVPINGRTKIAFGFRLVGTEEYQAILILSRPSTQQRKYRATAYPLESRYDNEDLWDAFSRWVSEDRYPEIEQAKEEAEYALWVKTPEGKQYIKLQEELEKKRKLARGQLGDLNAKPKLPTMKDFDLR